MNWPDEFVASAARQPRIPTLSLFTGAGGLDLGFHLAGFEVVASVEIEEKYCATLRANARPGALLSQEMIVHCADIRNFVESLDTESYIAAGVDCVIGGPPCQTFSAAGRRSGGVLGTSDERGQLFLSYCEVLDALRPRVFVFENVYGLPGANGGQPWREIVGAFTEIGYTLSFEVLDAADYGVPQHRERLILVGSRENEFVFPLPTHGPDSPSSAPFVSAGEAIADLQDPDEPYHNDLGGRYGHLLPLVPPGLNYSFFTAEMGYPEPVFAWRSKFHDLLYKVDPDGPSRTIKARPGKFTGPFHWNNRHFTTAEMKRLQTFPDDYELVGTTNKVVEQIGNSVPPRMAAVIATSVREQLFASASKASFPVRPQYFVSTFRQRQRERSRQFKEIAIREIRHRFGEEHVVAPPANGQRTKYRVATGLFDIETHSRRPRAEKSKESSVFKSVIERSSSHLSVTCNELPTEELPCTKLKLQIDGLEKYLVHTDTLSLDARLNGTTGIFHAWSLVEDALVSGSQFFTLIDIYGHYANRGDTVRVESLVESTNGNRIEQQVLTFFGSSDNCGGFHSLAKLARELGFSSTAMSNVIRIMRELRYDIRTHTTHPTIRPGKVICTYPFPLLSEKAQLQRALG